MVGPPRAKGCFVVELELGGFAAALAARVDVAAARAVALAHGAADGGGDRVALARVVRVARCAAPARVFGVASCTALARLVRRGVLLLLELVDELAQRAQVHCFDGAIGHGVGEQVAGSFEQVDVFLRGGELDLVALGPRRRGWLVALRLRRVARALGVRAISVARGGHLARRRSNPPAARRAEARAPD